MRALVRDMRSNPFSKSGRNPGNDPHQAEVQADADRSPADARTRISGFAAARHSPPYVVQQLPFEKIKTRVDDMTQQAPVSHLVTLVQLDIDAARAYAQAIDAIDTPSIRD